MSILCDSTQRAHRGNSAGERPDELGVFVGSFEGNQRRTEKDIVDYISNRHYLPPQLGQTAPRKWSGLRGDLFEKVL